MRRYLRMGRHRVEQDTGVVVAFGPIRPRSRVRPDPAPDRDVRGRSGDDDSPFGDTWTWDGSVWKRHVPAVSPPRRAKFAMVWDGARKRVVLFGGFSKGIHYDDTWAWDGTTWSK